MNQEAFVAGILKVADQVTFLRAAGNSLAHYPEMLGKWLGTSPLPQAAANVRQVEAEPYLPLPGIGEWGRNKGRFFPVNSEGQKEWGGFEHAGNVLNRSPFFNDIKNSWGQLPTLAKWLIPMGGAALLGGMFRGGNNTPNITVNVPPSGGGGIPQQAMFRGPNEMPGMRTA